MCGQGQYMKIVNKVESSKGGNGASGSDGNIGKLLAEASLI